MAKRTMMWAVPSLAFVVAVMATLLSGPSWATLSRRSLSQASSSGTCGCKDCCSPGAGNVSGIDSNGNNNTYCSLGGVNPVNYYTGEHIFGSTDLKDGGFDGMKASRHFVTLPGYSDNTFGSCWRWGVPQLVDVGSQVNLVMGSRHAKSWTKVLSGGVVVGYTPDFFYKDTLSIYDANTLVFNDEDGNTMIFYNFTYPTASFRGKLYQAFNAYVVTPNSAGFSGSYIQADYTSGGIFGGMTQQEETSGVVDTANVNEFTANLGGPFANLVTTAVFQFHVVNNTTNTVRSTSEQYYDGTKPANGPAGMLNRVIVMDPSSNTIEEKYYRYGSATGTGIVTLRTVVEGAAYERLLAALTVQLGHQATDTDVDNASDTTIAPYANTYVYDTNGRITSETIQGLGTYAFNLAVSNSGFANDTNAWQRKTVETLPDGNTNTVYTSYTGQAMLKVFTQGTQQWCQAYQYDGQARLVLEAMPSAVASFTESSPGLFTLNTTGLVNVTNYASTTTATTTTAGDVAGYVKTRQVKQGGSGTPITTEAYTYIAHSSTALVSVTKYAVASKTVYRNTDGTGAQTTTLTYSWLIPPGTSTQSNQIESVTVTYPPVSTAENGSGIATANIQFRDKWRHPTWFKDEDGFIQMKTWDRLTGACTQSIVDVNTSVVGGAPSGWSTPAGGGLDLTTTYVDDYFGRWTKITDPNNNVTYIVYQDANWQVRTYPGWTGTTTTGPTRVTRQDKPGSYKETLTMSVAPHVTSGAPDGTEGISSVITDSRDYLDTGNRVINQDSYFNPPAVWTASTTYGAIGSNFYRKSYGYDSKGRQNHAVDWTGTIRDTTYDGRDRITVTKIGTNDTTSPNMIQDQGFQYDAGGIGDGNLTKSSLYTSASTTLDTLYQYDFRDRQTQVTRPDAIISVLTLDNLGEMTLEQTYSGSVGSANLRAQQATSFDEKHQAYQSIVTNINPSTGATGDTLTTNSWFNARGSLVKTRGPNGEFQKTQYDGARRVLGSFICFDDSEVNTDYNSALTVNSGTGINADTVVEETVYAYDASSNLIETTTYRRTTSTAKLGDLSVSWSANDSRRMFTAQWFDSVNRPTGFSDYGTNGGTTLSRPSSPPAHNSTSYLLTTYSYDAGGRQYQILDNLNRLTQKTFDGLNRVTQIVEDYTGTGVPTETSLDTNKTTASVYDTSGRLSQRVASNPKGSGNGVQSQTTTYVYGTIANQATPAVYRNDILVAEIYPDSDDTYTPGNPAGSQLGNGADGVYDRVEYTYDYASRKSTTKDQRGVVRTDTYDPSGRYSAETVTTLPSGVDGSVLRMGMTYDSLSRKQLVSNYSDTGGTTVFSQVKYTYDGWGNAIERDDSHVGAVVPGTTPSVQMAYSDGGSGGVGKYVRPSSITYPNGRVVYYNYPAAGATSVGDHLSRIDNIANDSAGSSQFGQYTYMGAGKILDVNHPLVTNGLVYRQGPDTNPGAWDQFDRQLYTKWRNSGQTTTFDMYNYTYDVVSNRLTRQNAASTLPATPNDEYYVYDGLNRLTKMNRGKLTGTPLTIADSASNYELSWPALESLGNWRGFNVAPSGGGNYTFQQTRSHNSANEIDVDNNDANAPGTSISNSWTPPTADKAGNTTTCPVPGNETAGYFNTYDAWNRLVKVQNGTRAAPGTEVVEYQYDAENWRVVKLVPNGSNWNRTDYYFSMSWQCVEERKLTNVSGKTTVATTPSFQWVWDLKYIDAVLLRDVVPIDTSKRLYYCQDVNQNTTALITQAGVVAERYVYDSYGKVTVLSSTWTSQSATTYNNEILFAGYRKDPETQLHLSRNRSYHSTLGRWMQRDPLKYDDGMNLYEYVRSTPPNMTDSLGLAGGPTRQNAGQENSPPHNDPGPCIIQAHTMFMAVAMAKKAWGIPGGPKSQPGEVSPGFEIGVAGTFNATCCCKEAKVQTTLYQNGVGIVGGHQDTITVDVPSNIGKGFWLTPSFWSISSGSDPALWSWVAGQKPIRGAPSFFVNVAWTCTKDEQDGSSVPATLGTWYISNWKFPNQPNTWAPKLRNQIPEPPKK